MRYCLSLIACLGMIFATPLVAGEVLVLTDGSMVPCKEYRQKGNLYVVTLENGTLTSVRADKVDLDATRAYAEELVKRAEAEAAAAAAAEEEAVAPKKEAGQGPR